MGVAAREASPKNGRIPNAPPKTTTIKYDNDTKAVKLVRVRYRHSMKMKKYSKCIRELP